MFYPLISGFYPLIRVLSPNPSFIPSSAFYPLIRVLFPHPCFIPPSEFYPSFRVLSPHPCFIPPSVFYPLIRVLFPHPCFIPSSVFYPLIRVLSPHIRVSSSHPYPCHPYPYSCFISIPSKHDSFHSNRTVGLSVLITTVFSHLNGFRFQRQTSRIRLYRKQ